eukprot:8774866-Lingulodinium_polyedra.AAC.1
MVCKRAKPQTLQLGFCKQRWQRAARYAHRPTGARARARHAAREHVLVAHRDQILNGDIDGPPFHCAER